MIHVPEPESALAWYASLFPQAVPSASSDGTFHFLVIDAVQLEFVPSDSKVTSGAAGSVVYWQVPSLAKTISHAQDLGAQLYRGPMQIEPGVSMCQVRDPWGNCIGFRGQAQ
jgi:predicted enzyme related to lactoylglutathione lyase